MGNWHWRVLYNQTVSDDSDFEQQEEHTAAAALEDDVPLMADGELPSLGLSYRRGERAALGSSMTQFLIQLQGHPWTQMNDDCDWLVAEGKQNAYPHHAPLTACSRLLALRAGTRSLVSGAEAENLARVVSELGGPQTVARMTGLVDDLLVQICASPLSVMRSLMLAARRLHCTANAYRRSLRAAEGGQRVVLMTAPRRKTVKTCLEALRHGVCDVTNQWIQFWQPYLSQHHSATDDDDEDQLQCLFDADTWTQFIQPQLSDANSEPQLASANAQLRAACDAVLKQVHSCDAAVQAAFMVDLSELNQCRVCVEQFVGRLRQCAEVCSQHRGFRRWLLGGLERTCVELERQLDALEAECAPVDLTARENALDGEFAQLVDQLIGQLMSSLEVAYFADRSLEGPQLDLLQHFVQSLGTLCDSNLTPLEKCLERCVQTLLSQPTELILTGSRLLLYVLPLMDSLCAAVRTRLVQLWQLMQAWFELGQFALRVTNRLLTDGFCRPAQMTEAGAGNAAGDSTGAQDTAEGSAGATSLTAQGVDSTGAKDVSKELDCLEQIEGLQGEAERAGEEEETNTEQSEGIEMPEDNFGGSLEDVDRMEQEDDEDDGQMPDDDEEEPENRAGETGGVTDGLSKEMWASEDEEDEEEEGKKKDKKDDETGGVEDKPSGSDSRQQDQRGDVQDSKKPADDGSDSVEENVDEKEPVKNVGEEANKKPSRKNKRGKDTTTVAGDETANEDVDPKFPDGEEDDSDEMSTAEQEQLQLEGAEEDEAEEEEPFELPPDSESMDVDEDEAAAGDRELDMDTGADEVEEEGNIETTGVVEQELDQTVAEEPEAEDSFPQHLGAAGGDLDTFNVGTGGENATSKPDAPSLPPPSDQRQSSEAGSCGGEQTMQTSQAGTNQQTRGEPGSALPPRTDARSRGPRPTGDSRTQDLREDTEARSGLEILEADDCAAAGEPPGQPSTEADLVQHVKDMLDAVTQCVFDSATDQQKQQQQQNKTKEDDQLGQESVGCSDETDRLPANADEEPIECAPSLSRPAGPTETEAGGVEFLIRPDPDLELVSTLGAQRPPESMTRSRPECLSNAAEPTVSDVELASGALVYDTASVADSVTESQLREWLSCSERAHGLSRQLCEALRLVLEPTKAAKLKGDFRTGKRINMRKIIPYLASQFRKDKIWLRRSQPSQREYRILIAVDDSSSMADNLCRQMTFEALATVINALNMLEVGRVGVCSFGESVRVLHDLRDSWVGNAGAHVLSKFTFTQSRTSLTQLLHCAISLMRSLGVQAGSNRGQPCQLLLILSDGIFSEDPQDPLLNAAVRLARDARLFPVCLILDDVRKKHSILDLRRYTKAGKLQPYMDDFPLPFYVLLRDVTALPSLLSDCLRQWFELEASYAA